MYGVGGPAVTSPGEVDTDGDDEGVQLTATQDEGTAADGAAPAAVGESRAIAPADGADAEETSRDTGDEQEGSQLDQQPGTDDESLDPEPEDQLDQVMDPSPGEQDDVGDGALDDAGDDADGENEEPEAEKAADKEADPAAGDGGAGYVGKHRADDRVAQAATA
jgi:hypothetical protein